MPTLSGGALKRRLEARQFKDLFVEELGWDRLAGVSQERLLVDGAEVRLEGVVQKRAVPVYLHRGADLPDRQRRRRIERELSRRQLEHLVVFLDETSGAQVWQWVKREPGRPERVREHAWRPGEPVEPLRQKLDALQFTLEEEESGRIGPTEVTGRLKRAFDADRVTKGFYTEFKSQHDALLAFLKGLPDEALRSWYASVVLNRLMFVYFIQKKGFIDGNTNYLNEKLAYSKAKLGRDRFLSGVLGPLFFRGFALPKAERTAADKALLGNVPYLNGGLFQEHQIERDHGDKIALPDKAFEALFAFFDGWRWHLDERGAGSDVAGPSAQARAGRGGEGREINPDVLGYIFEKYVNQKQMGAYYTKEDITEYICANTILPRLLDKVREQVPVAFKGEGSIWRLLREDPDRYIWPSVRHGVDQPLPQTIAVGVADVAQRSGWDRPASPDLGLPTETWREVVHRRERCEALRTRMRAGDLASPDALVTANLDIARFVQDAIQAASEDALKAWWSALSGLTVLDPACGSGAFLFAALNLLEPLYTKVFEAMQTTVADARRAVTAGGRPFEKARYKPLTDVLDEAARHANPSYFVLRHVALSNLYGVDIMEEAAEICKLRLFLKLVAQLDHAERIEPLPDLDFNIRSGNSLIGFASRAQLDAAVGSQLDFTGTADRIEQDAGLAAKTFDRFRQLQEAVSFDGAELRETKQNLQERLVKVAVEANDWLARQCGVDPSKPRQFQVWRKNHEPFHWWTEFFGIMASGGFDVIVGNPPYAEIPRETNRNALVGAYSIALPRWSRDEDLSAFFIERSNALVNPAGIIGMICPLSFAASTKGTFVALRDKILSSRSVLWLSHFDRIPSALFGGDVRTRCTIVMYRNSERDEPTRYTTELKRWNAVERPFLTQMVSYCEMSTSIKAGIPKFGSQLQADTLKHLSTSSPTTLGVDLTRSLSFNQLAAGAPKTPSKSVLVGGVAYNWFPVWRRIPPTTQADGTPSLPARTIGFQFASEDEANIIFALLASSLGYWWWATASDGFNLKKWLVESFPLSVRHVPQKHHPALAKLGAELWLKLRSFYVYKDNKGRIGNYYLPRCEAEILAIDDFLADHVPGLSRSFFESVRASNKAFSSLSDESSEEEAAAA
jgi:hypothetical protein